MKESLKEAVERLGAVTDDNATPTFKANTLDNSDLTDDLCKLDLSCTVIQSQQQLRNELNETLAQTKHQVRFANKNLSWILFI